MAINPKVIQKAVKDGNLGEHNKAKDFVPPTSTNSVIKRRVNNKSRKCTVIWMDCLPPSMKAELEQGICTYITHWHLMSLLLVSTVLSLDPGDSTGTSQPRSSSSKFSPCTQIPSPAPASPTVSVGTSASVLLFSSDEEEAAGESADTVVETPATNVCVSHETINYAPLHKRKSISSSGQMPKQRRTRQNTQLPDWSKDLNSCNPLQK